MKLLQNFFEKLEPKARKNKYLHTTYDAFHTFFFAPDHVTHNGTHIKDSMDIKRTMVLVVISMQLCLLFGMWNVGHWHYAAYGQFMGYDEGFIEKFVFGLLQVLPLIIVAHVVGLGIEFIFAAIKRHQVEEGFLVTGMLIPLIMPPDIPLWMVAVATAFSVVIAKEAFGGTGMNILNIALVTRVFIFFAYPTYISGDTAWITWDTNILHDLFGMGAQAAQYGPSFAIQGFSGATPLGLAATGMEIGGEVIAGLPAVAEKYTWWEMLIGFVPGSIGETSKIAILMGIGILLFTRVGSWRIMASMFAGAIVTGILFNIIGGHPFLEIPWYYHLVMGSFLFALAFMATDPVTAAQTDPGKLVFGFFIGVIGMIVRVLNPAFPEGWMLAILFMNVFAPLIDHIIINMNIKKRLARG